MTRAGFARVTQRRWVRWLPLLLTPVLLWTSTYPGHFAVSTTYIAVALVSALVFAVGDRWPAATAIAISALAVPMLASEAWGPSEVVPYLGAVALVDVAVRCRGAVTAVVAACWLAAQIVGTVLHPSGTLPWRYTAVSLAISVAVPVLLGAYLRAHRDLSDAYRARALAAEQSRMAAEARARADERVALARELHDLVAHHMSSIVLRIRVARSVVDAADPRLRAAMDDIADTSAGVLADIRALLAALRDDPTVVSALGESTKLEAEITAAVERVRAVGFSVLDSIDPDLDGINAVSRLTLLRVVQESLTNVMKYGDRHQDVSAAPAATSAVDSPSLTPREREVLALVAEGLSNQEIAERLHLGVTTVKTHVANLMDKTSSANRVRLAVFAVRDGHTP